MRQETQLVLGPYDGYSLSREEFDRQDCLQEVHATGVGHPRVENKGVLLGVCQTDPRVERWNIAVCCGTSSSRRKGGRRKHVTRTVMMMTVITGNMS